MNAKKFSDAMSELDTKYVDEALNYKKKSQKPVWVKLGAMAACLCLIVAAIITVPSMLNPQEIDSGEAGGLAGGNENVSENILQFPDTIKTIEVTYLVYSSEISRELSQDEIVAIKEWATALELEHMSYGEGEAPNEVYAGGESWVFDVNNGEIKFTYSIIDLYCALLGYIIFEGSEEERNMNTLVDMISGMEVKEDDEDFLNAVDYMFKGLEQRKPDCFAVKQYKKYKLASGDVCSK